MAAHVKFASEACCWAGRFRVLFHCAWVLFGQNRLMGPCHVLIFDCVPNVGVRAASADGQSAQGSGRPLES